MLQWCVPGSPSCSSCARSAQPRTSSWARSAGDSRSILLASTSSGIALTAACSSSCCSACRASGSRVPSVQSTTKISAPHPRTCANQSLRNRRWPPRSHT
eukprot:3884634-Prymnesium_polylepis.1